MDQGPSPNDRLSLLEAGERVAALGSWDWRPGSGKLVWSDNLYRIFGREPARDIPSVKFVLDHAHPDDRERVRRYLEMARHESNPPPLEYRIVRPEHGVRYLRSTITTIEAGQGSATRIVGAVQDVTEQRLLSREVAAHIAVSSALLGWDRLESGATRLLSELGGAIEAVVGSLWVPEGDVLRARVGWRDHAFNEAADFQRATAALRLEAGTGPLRDVWRSQRVVVIGDVRRCPDFRRLDAATRAGLRTAVAFPAVHRGGVVAVLEFYYRDEIRPDDLFKQTLLAIGYELGQFLSARLGQLHAQPLTARELEVLRLSADGYSRPRIAEELSIRPTTVATHLKHAYEKLGVADRTSAVAALMRRGLLD